MDDGGGIPPSYGASNRLHPDGWIPHAGVRLTRTQLAAWRSFLRAHAEVTRKLQADLLAEHQLPLAWYDVMVQLVEAPGRRLRMTDLAGAVVDRAADSPGWSTGWSPTAWSAASAPRTTPAAPSPASPTRATPGCARPRPPTCVAWPATPSTG